jgi:hypothetical protein
VLGRRPLGPPAVEQAQGSISDASHETANQELRSNEMEYGCYFASTSGSTARPLEARASASLSQEPKPPNPRLRHNPHAQNTRDSLIVQHASQALQPHLRIVCVPCAGGLPRCRHCHSSTAVTQRRCGYVQLPLLRPYADAQECHGKPSQLEYLPLKHAVVAYTKPAKLATVT